MLGYHRPLFLHFSHQTLPLFLPPGLFLREYFYLSFALLQLVGQQVTFSPDLLLLFLQFLLAFLELEQFLLVFSCLFLHFLELLSDLLLAISGELVQQGLLVVYLLLGPF